MWDQGIFGRAYQAEPVIIVLQDPTLFPNQKQDPLKREPPERQQQHAEGLIVCFDVINGNFILNITVFF